MSKTKLVWLCMCLAMVFILVGCQNIIVNPVNKATLIITSVNENAGAGAGLANFQPMSSGFTVEPNEVAGFINSAAPEYLKVTLKEIRLEGDFGNAVIWSGTRELYLDGTTDVDVSDLQLQNIPTGIVSKVALKFASTAKIKGEVTGYFTTDTQPETKTYYTKANYPYDAVNHTGGASLASVFETSPSEEMDITLGGDGTDIEVGTSVTYEIKTGDTPVLTILFDLNRMLRFYNGLNLEHEGGVNPPDPADKAYFFSHSIFGGSVACFFGLAGEIQGYETVYAAYDINTPIGNGLPCAIRGWMTLIYDANGNFISGSLIGNDDNALTVAKGSIVDYQTGQNGVDFTYDLDNHTSIFHVYGFNKVETVGDSTPVAEWDGPSNHGEAIYTLRLQK